jgi:hypothetical protein
MDHHILLFDCRNITTWIYHQSDRVVLSTRQTGDLRDRIRKRLHGNTDFLNEAAEIRRNVMRFDNGRGVPVYYVRFPQVHSFTNVIIFFLLNDLRKEPTQQAYNVWNRTLSNQQL